MSTHTNTDNTVSTAHDDFIVKVYKWEDEKYHHHCDGMVKVYANGEFVINNDETRIDIVTGNFSLPDTMIVHGTKTLSGTYNVEILTPAGKFGIKFDSQSSTCYDRFLKLYNNVKHKHLKVTHYPSGRIHFECPVDADGLRDGRGIERYDNPANTVKYVGDFEDDFYDGSGNFYSADGFIRIQANNICSGEISGVGTVYVSDNVEKVNFEKRPFSTFKTDSVTFCNDVCKSCVGDSSYYPLIKQAEFRGLSTDEKLMHIFNELVMLRKEISGKKIWNML